MANREQFEILRKGAAAWNEWRRGRNTEIHLSTLKLDGIDLSGVDLSGADLSKSQFIQTSFRNANLSGAKLPRAFLVESDFTDANLQGAWLSGADLAAANLTNADLTGAVLDAADLSWTFLNRTNFCNADLTLTRFRSAEFKKTNMTRAGLDGTLFADVDLSKASGLSSCIHLGPSVIDHITLQRSGELPLRFLRGIGLQETLIASLPAIRSSPEHYSCFISYSHKDEKFAARLHKDLRQINIKCWFAPHDLPIGGKILDEISGAIRTRDKVVLILSEASIASDWVEDEVTQAFEEERRRSQTVLFPIRLDDAVMDSNEPWAAKLRARHIGDFRAWTRPKNYEDAFERVRRDLMRTP